MPFHQRVMFILDEWITNYFVDFVGDALSALQSFITEDILNVGSPPLFIRGTGQIYKEGTNSSSHLLLPSRCCLPLMAEEAERMLAKINAHSSHTQPSDLPKVIGPIPGDKLMANCSVLDFDATEIARQICLRDQQALAAIPRRELLNGAYNSSKTSPILHTFLSTHQVLFVVTLRIHLIVGSGESCAG